MRERSRRRGSSAEIVIDRDSLSGYGKRKLSGGCSTYSESLIGGNQPSKIRVMIWQEVSLKVQGCDTYQHLC